MKHKEHDHVKQVRFHPGSLSDNHCIFHAEVNPYMKTTGSYSTVVTLSRLAMSSVHAASVKQEQVDAACCCIVVQHP